MNSVSGGGVVRLELGRGCITYSDDPVHPPNHDLVIDSSLPLDIIQTRNDGQVAEEANAHALLIGNDLGHPPVNPRLHVAPESWGRRKPHSPWLASFLRQPLDHIRWEVLGRFDRMTGAKQHRFFIIVESGVAVFPVYIGPLCS